MARTFLQARSEILSMLREHYWTVNANLKVPHATSPNGLLRLWFKAQAVYVTKIGARERHDYHAARTLPGQNYELDIRKLTPDEFFAIIEDLYGPSVR